MVTEVAKRLINVEEYYLMAEVGILKPGDSVELIQGEIYEMSPAGSKHGSVVKKLSKILNALLSKTHIIAIQDPVRFDKKTEPEPDISILRFRQDYYADKHPGADDIYVIIEVADSSLKYDRGIKKDLYAKFKIPEYWIINLDEKLIEVFSKPKDGDYESKDLFHSNDTISLLNTEIQVSDIFPF